jgi:hypothetical protein
MAKAYIYQPFPVQDIPIFTQIGIFGLKINHLAVLLRESEILPTLRKDNFFSMGEIPRRQTAFMSQFYDWFLQLCL